MKESVAPQPVTPGRFIEREFLEPYEMSVSKLANALCIPEERTKVLVSDEGRIDGELALRLSTYFGNSARFWIQYDLQIAEIKYAEEITKKVIPREQHPG